MKRNICFFVVFCTYSAYGQSITLTPNANYPVTVKSNSSASYGQFSTKATAAAIEFYHSATNSNLGTQAGVLTANSNGLNLFGFANSTLSAVQDVVIGAGITEKMRIKANGNVGIGLANPIHHVEVVYTGDASAGWGGYIRPIKIGLASNGSHRVIDDYDAIGLAGYGNNAMSSTGKRNIGILGTTGSNGSENIAFYSSQNDAFSGGQVFGLKSEITNSANASSWGVYSNINGTGGGNRYGVFSVAYGTGNNYGIYGAAFNGTSNLAGFFAGNVTINGTLTNPSDEKFKKNLTQLDNALDKVMSLNPSTYEYKTEEYAKAGFAKGQHYGFTAQVVQKMFPQLVSENTLVNPDSPTEQTSTKYLSVNYIEIIPVLTKAIQEQQEMIKELQTEILKLKK